MTRSLIIIAIIIVIALGFGVAWTVRKGNALPGITPTPAVTPTASAIPSPTTTPKPSTILTPSPTPAASSDVSVTLPQPNQTIASPVTITGQARGSWFFEASFPINVVDANGTVVGQGTAQAQGDWMTDNLVPFTASVSFRKPATSTGTIILNKDNPSGRPEGAGEFKIPVRF